MSDSSNRNEGTFEAVCLGIVTGVFLVFTFHLSTISRTLKDIRDNMAPQAEVERETGERE